MHTQPPPPEQHPDSLPHDEIRRPPRPVVSLSLAAVPPATLVSISALANHPRLVVTILFLTVGVATTRRLSPV